MIQATAFVTPFYINNLLYGTLLPIRLSACQLLNFFGTSVNLLPTQRRKDRYSSQRMHATLWLMTSFVLSDCSTMSAAYNFFSPNARTFDFFFQEPLHDGCHRELLLHFVTKPFASAFESHWITMPVWSANSDLMFALIFTKLTSNFSITFRFMSSHVISTVIFSPNLNLDQA